MDKRTDSPSALPTPKAQLVECQSGFLRDHPQAGLLFSQRWRLGGEEGKRAVMSLFDSSLSSRGALST